MTDLRKDLRNLLLEAEQLSARELELLARDEKIKQETEKRLADRKEREQREKELKSKSMGGNKRFSKPTSTEPTKRSSSFWSSPAFYLLCDQAIIRTGCLDKLSICLSKHFNPNPDTNKSFYDGINYFISFYIDVIHSYNNKLPQGKVLEALHALSERSSDVISPVASSTLAEVSNLFYGVDADGKPLADRADIEIKDYDLLVQQITDACIASNIVNWERLLTYQDARNASGILAVKDIYKQNLPSDSPVNKDFVSNLSSEVINDFYASNNDFSIFLSKFSWGKPKELTVEAKKVIDPEQDRLAREASEAEEAALVAKRLADYEADEKAASLAATAAWEAEVAAKKAEEAAISADEGVGGMAEPGAIADRGDRGAITGDNEVFLYNVLIRYLSNIITSDKLDVNTIFTDANKRSVSLAFNTADNIKKFKSIDQQQEENANAELEDKFDYDLDNPDRINALGVAAGVDLGEESDSLPNIISFNTYIEKQKALNDWNTKNTLEFLSTTLKTVEGADGLSTIITHLFSKLPDTLFGHSFDCPIVVDNNIQNFNVLSKVKQEALTNSKFISFLSDIIVEMSEINLDTEGMRENKSAIIRELASLLQEAKRGDTQGAFGLFPVDIEELIEELPKTREDAIKAFSISQGGGGYSVKYNNIAAKKVNAIYGKLAAKFPVLSRVSPSVTSQIPSEGLTAESTLQRDLGLTIVPKSSATATTVSGLTPEEVRRRLSSTRLDVNLQSTVKQQKLNELFDIYLKTITEILKPSVNLANWGLYKPIPATAASGKRDLANAKIIAAFPSAAVPEGTKVDGKLVSFLFPSEAAFNPVRDAIITAVASSRSKFLQVTDLRQVDRQLLPDIIAAFGPPPPPFKTHPLSFFGSYDTVTGTKEAKSCKLFNLVDPKLAITGKLELTNQDHKFVKGSVNPFVDLVSNLLVLNNSSTTEAIINNKLTLLTEDVETFELPICYAAINTQIRAKLLLALVRLFDSLEDILIIIRRYVTDLHTVLASKLSGDNVGEIASLFKYIASSALSTAIANPQTEEEVAADIKAKTDPVNNRFSREEATRAALVAGEEDIPVNLSPNTYG